MGDSHDSGSDTTVYVTGFGPFANIKVNPSSTVGRKVAAALEQRGDLTAVHFTEMETSVAAASAYFDDLEKQLDVALRADPKKKILLFHVGVHSQERRGVLRVETVGYNELHASVPDVRGVQFSHDPINSDDGGIETRLESFFAMNASVCGVDNATRLIEIINELNASNKSRAQRAASLQVDHFASSSLAVPGQQALVMPTFQQPHWVLSSNAGRYLCNYCLYRGLRLQRKYTELAAQQFGDAATSSPPVTCVFVHVCDPTQGKASLAPKSDSEETSDTVGVDTRGDSPALLSPAASTIVAEYNPSLMEQSQQTAMVAYRLVDWVRGL